MNFKVTLFTLVISSQASAFTYSLKCDANRRMESVEVSKGPNENLKAMQLCERFLARGLKCFDHASPIAKDKVALNTAVDSLVANRSSNLYSTPQLRAIIRAALENDVDPYALLAITLIENPPVGSEESTQYKNSYGLIPIDAPAFAEFFNCRPSGPPKMKAQKIEYWVNENGGKGTLEYNTYDSPIAYVNKGTRRKLDFRSNKSAGERQGICLGPQIGPGQAPEIGFENSIQDANCCADVQTDVRSVPTDLSPAAYSYSNFKYKIATETPENVEATNNGYKLREQLFTAAAADYVKRKFALVPKLDFFKAAKTQEEQMALILQSYNGFGQLGAGESIYGCLRGLKMKIQPIYGTKAADLIFNVLYANSNITQLIKDEAAIQKKTTTRSLACDVWGEGNHQVQGLSFVELQEKYLKDQKGCSFHTFSHRFPVGASGAKSSKKTYQYNYMEEAVKNGPIEPASDDTIEGKPPAQ